MISLATPSPSTSRSRAPRSYPPWAVKSGWPSITSPLSSAESRIHFSPSNRQAPDCDSLREILGGLDGLEQQLSSAQTAILARQRGYFTPDEDDRVRQMLLAYRSYRLGLYEIIYRYIDYEQIEEPTRQLRAFMVGFAAALTLYAKSLKLIQSYEHEPLIRQKLNEPDVKFGLEAGYFDDVLWLILPVDAPSSKVINAQHHYPFAAHGG